MKGAAGLTRKPAAAAELERAAQSWSLAKAAAGRVAQLDNTHMGSHLLERPEY